MIVAISLGWFTGCTDLIQSQEKHKFHEYENEVNHLREGDINLKGRDQLREHHGVQLNDRMQIVWTSANKVDWNYCVPELHEALNPEYPSKRLFWKKKIKAKTYLEVSIPDTPYYFYIVDGQFSSYFYDSKKDVIWRLNSAALESAFKGMRRCSTSSKTLEFLAGGGDYAEYLIVDFSSKENSPIVTYRFEYHGY